MEYNGRHLKGMLAAASQWLEKAVPQIDALNVFPVPDGDTGTNMHLTMRSTLEEASFFPGESAAEVMAAIARGALLGARGNSGVILSQVWRGLAQGLEGKTTFTPADWASALKLATALAYQGLSRPVEGTILTVVREAAEAAERVASDSHDLTAMVEAMLQAAGDALARTPDLLPVLKQAGVVDAGGQGYYTILEGSLRFLRGENMEVGSPIIFTPTVAPREAVVGEEEKEVYGYCTELLIRGQGLDPRRIRRRLEREGQSVIVAGDETAVKLHVHTLDPGRVLHYMGRLGTLHGILIRNMDDQHREYLVKRQALAPPVPLALVAVACGEGLMKLFQSLGVQGVVPGGQTMNPSTRELLQAIQGAPSQSVILLPNNKNIVLTAQQARALSAKRVEVVATESIAQGVAALLAFNYEADLRSNVQAMEEARQRVKTVEITWAVRPVRLGRLRIKKGQAIGLLDGELVAAEDHILVLLEEMLPRLELEKAEMVTIYAGADSRGEGVEEVRGFFQQRCPQVEVVEGGQPYYNFIISIE